MNFVFAATLQGEDSDNVAGIFAVGGDGSAAGNGGDVNVRHNGDILTHGDASGGILAQSIAGGGGNANFNVGLGAGPNATALTVSRSAAAAATAASPATSPSTTSASSKPTATSPTASPPSRSPAAAAMRR